MFWKVFEPNYFVNFVPLQFLNKHNNRLSGTPSIGVEFARRQAEQVE
jgi:hypothetical protein